MYSGAVYRRLIRVCFFILRVFGGRRRKIGAFFFSLDLFLLLLEFFRLIMHA
jgi:hypothetical protein